MKNQYGLRTICSLPIFYFGRLPHSRVELESTLYKRVILTVIRVGHKLDTLRILLAVSLFLQEYGAYGSSCVDNLNNASIHYNNGVGSFRHSRTRTFSLYTESRVEPADVTLSCGFVYFFLVRRTDLERHVFPFREEEHLLSTRRINAWSDGNEEWGISHWSEVHTPSSIFHIHCIIASLPPDNGGSPARFIDAVHERLQEEHGRMDGISFHQVASFARRSLYVSRV